MAAENGRQNLDLSDQLLSQAYRFDFFQAVRILERLAGDVDTKNPQFRGGPVGQDRSPDTEMVRFRAHNALGFPPAAIHQMRSRSSSPGGHAAGPALEMSVTFFGLTGPEGVLPQHYTAQLLRRMRDKDFALRDFLDLFNHRSISLFYRAWEKCHITVAYERYRSENRSEPDLLTWCLYCMAGMGTDHLRGRLKIDDEAFLFYGGHFAHFPRSAAGLEAMLQDYFQIDVEVMQMHGQWLNLELEDRSLMPTLANPHGRNNQLGLNMIIGDRVWDVQSKFRVRIGPLNYRQFARFLPNGDGLLPLAQMARAYVGPELDFDVQPILIGPEVPWCQLCADGPSQPFLGWNTWVRNSAFKQDVEDAVFVEDAAFTVADL
jgi:type VI secretion system protein ImpH